MKVSIVGTGYVGLVTGACLADHGHDVVCVDVDPRKIAVINDRRSPIHEVGLDALLERTVGQRLSATADLASAVLGSDFTFIAVGTPAANGRIDLGYVEAAAREIGSALARKDSYHVVVVKSTVVPGTTDTLVSNAVAAASGKVPGRDFGVAMNPEFLTEGQAVEDFMNPDRIVVGGIDDRSRDSVAALYHGFPDVPRILTNCRTAEMIKYASNSVLATMISFSNEIGRLCSAIGGIDVAEVMRGVHEAAYFTKPSQGGTRWHAPITGFLQAGCGFGGSCLPKDVTALIGHGRAAGLEMPLLSSVLEINRSQPAELLQLIRGHYPDLKAIPVTVLGLAFKQDTDDLRESPAFPILRSLLDSGADVTVYDPVARLDSMPDLASKVRVAASLEDALSRAEVVVHVTKWKDFERSGAVLRGLGRSPLVVDGRRNLNPLDFARYEGVGRRELK